MLLFCFCFVFVFDRVWSFWRCISPQLLYVRRSIVIFSYFIILSIFWRENTTKKNRKKNRRKIAAILFAYRSGFWLVASVWRFCCWPFLSLCVSTDLYFLVFVLCGAVSNKPAYKVHHASTARTNTPRALRINLDCCDGLLPDRIGAARGRQRPKMAFYGPHNIRTPHPPAARTKHKRKQKKAWPKKTISGQQHQHPSGDHFGVLCCQHNRDTTTAAVDISFLRFFPARFFTTTTKTRARSGHKKKNWTRTRSI